jgi:hypothetical protein
MTGVDHLTSCTLNVSHGGPQVIRGGDGKWAYCGVGALDGKQAHISSVVEELSHCYATQICRKSTLLIDDDPQNISAALENGVNAILYCPSDASCVHRCILEMVSCHRISFNSEIGGGS